MTLPTFLGIGVQKAGTSWLDKLLRSHPEVSMAKSRKEVHYFDRYFDQPLSWYERFFTSTPHTKAVGETTPYYIYGSDIPGRIADVLGPDIKFILILRNPVMRAFSQYKMALSRIEFSGSFREFFDSHHDAARRGLYSEQIQRYYQFFAKENLLVLYYEEVFADENSPQTALASVAKHLGVSTDGFDASLIKEQVGKRNTVPIFPQLYRFVTRVKCALRHAGLEGVISFAKRLGFNHNLFVRTSQQAMPDIISPEDYAHIYRYYQDDIQKLERLLERDLSPLWPHTIDAPSEPQT